MKNAELGVGFSASGANQKAAKKINEILAREMRMVFPTLKIIKSGENFSKSQEKTLQITPFIREIKFIGGAARFWVGALAGSSAVLMDVSYRDSSNSQEIADAQFYRDAGAMTGGWSMGGTDNGMLEQIARDIVAYTSGNR